jgi:hypothetical protein
MRIGTPSIVASVLFALTLLPRGATAQNAPQVGRYQLMTIPKSTNEIGSTALVLDTATGDIWYWYVTPALGGSKGGYGLIYQGRAVPGSQPGEGVATYGFPKPAQISK